MRIPKVDPSKCDVVLWHEEGETYWLDVATREVSRVRPNKLAQLIQEFPESLTLCIMNDATGKLVPILPLAN